jgi:hypothetical protein
MDHFRQDLACTGSVGPYYRPWELFLNHSKSGRRYYGTTHRVGMKHAVDRKLLKPPGLLAGILIIGMDRCLHNVGEEGEKHFPWFEGQSTLQPLIE